MCLDKKMTNGEIANILHRVIYFKNLVASKFPLSSGSPQKSKHKAVVWHLSKEPLEGINNWKK